MSYRKEMEKYRDVDEDELLQKLSEEELKRLEDELQELDPDVSSGHSLHDIIPLSVTVETSDYLHCGFLSLSWSQIGGAGVWISV